MPKGLLIDTTRCIGCRGCQSACKQWNQLPGWGDAHEDYKTSFSPTMTNPVELNAKTDNRVEFFEVEEGGKLNWVFVHKRCFHCGNPSCVSVCPVSALEKQSTGAVTWDETRCIGCRYCQNACPFDIPKFEWEEAWPKIQKCTFCWNRIKDGMEPACAKTCPPDAIMFGERDEMLAEANARMAKFPGKYYNHIYGEHEAGGTSVMYLAAVPLDKLGFNMDVKTDEYPDYTWEFLSRVPIEVAAIAALMGGVYFFRKRRLDKVADKS